VKFKLKTRPWTRISWNLRPKIKGYKQKAEDWRSLSLNCKTISNLCKNKTPHNKQNTTLSICLPIKKSRPSPKNSKNDRLEPTQPTSVCKSNSRKRIANLRNTLKPLPQWKPRFLSTRKLFYLKSTPWRTRSKSWTWSKTSSWSSKIS
jgi:hypothetical protein